MIVKVKDLEWFEKNCKKYNGGYCNVASSFYFSKGMFKYCGKVIDLYQDQLEGWLFELWMYYEVLDEIKELPIGTEFCWKDEAILKVVEDTPCRNCYFESVEWCDRCEDFSRDLVFELIEDLKTKEIVGKPINDLVSKNDPAFIYDWDIILQPKTVVHCDTEEFANRLLKEATKKDLRWDTKDSYKILKEYNKYHSNTCYNLRDGVYGDLEYYLNKLKYTILTEDDILLNKELSDSKGYYVFDFTKFKVIDKYKTYKDAHNEAVKLVKLNPDSRIQVLEIKTNLTCNKVVVEE